jgi:hypothetical protein
MWLQKRYNKFFPSLLLLFWDLGSEIRDLGSGMDKIRIRCKHSGSATLDHLQIDAEATYCTMNTTKNLKYCTNLRVL